MTNRTATIEPTSDLYRGPADADDHATTSGPTDLLAARAADLAGGAAELARTLPATADRAAATAGQALEKAQRTVRGGSDAALLAGASLSAGLAVGLLVGRLPRVLAMLALVPATALAMVLVDRRTERTDRRTERTGPEPSVLH